MNYFIGAYYFLKLKEVNFGNINDSKLYTCSTCINHSYLDTWSLSWTVNKKESIKEATNIFDLTTTKIKEIQSWTDEKFEAEKIGWIHTFSDLETLKEYKNKFFKETDDFVVLTISFSEQEYEKAIRLIKPENSQYGEMGLFKKLKQKGLEKENNSTLGYDLIGIEESGDFHSFHCHDLSKELIDKFGITINKFGLIEENDKWEQMVEYMNEKENGFEPVPWFYVKVKRIEL